MFEMKIAKNPINRFTGKTKQVLQNQLNNNLALDCISIDYGINCQKPLPTIIPHNLFYCIEDNTFFNIYIIEKSTNTDNYFI